MQNIEDTPQKPWYKKKRYLIPAGILGVVLVASAAGSSPAYVPPQASTAGVVETTLPASKDTVKPASAETSTAVPLSNNNYYTNVSGNEVHSPAYAPAIPAGASARCGDGTYSFSQHRSGTCSHHGGVAEWF